MIGIFKINKIDIFVHKGYISGTETIKYWIRQAYILVTWSIFVRFSISFCLMRVFQNHQKLGANPASPPTYSSKG